MNPLQNPLQHKDVLSIIFKFLYAEDLHSVAITCKKWNFVYRTNVFVYDFENGKSINNKKLHLIRNLNVDKPVCFYSSKITDDGLINLSKYNKIKHLKLSNNFGLYNITDKSIIALAPTLESLDLFKCFKITHVGIQSLAKYSKIKVLRICDNDEINDKAFERLNFLEDLSIDYCDSENITDNVIKLIAGPNLRKLSLPGRIKNLEGLKLCNLTSLYLSGSKITDEQLKFIKPDNLKTLSLSWCENITDVGIINLSSNSITTTKGKLFLLDKLSLRKTQVTYASLMYISAIDLDIWGTQITDDGFLYLSSQTERLSIGEMHRISDECISHLENLPHLNYLLAPRTSISRKRLLEFKDNNPQIQFNIGI